MAGRHHRLRLALAFGACLPWTLQGCSPLHGYPADPEDTAATSADLQDYFGAHWIADYDGAEGNPARQRAIRDSVVLNRMRAYAISYSAFKRRLAGDSNTLNSGGDLLVLLLNGLGATTGGVATKSALAAASAGIVGAEGVINKDLYFQRTLPALLAQMDANRLTVQAIIIGQLQYPVDKYPLGLALLDLDQLRDAGGVPTAIGGLTLKAEDSKQAATSSNVQAEAALRGTKADVDAIPDKAQLNSRINALTDPQKVALANLALQRLGRLQPTNPDLSGKLLAEVPPSGRFAPSDITRVVTFLHEWAIAELPTTQSSEAWAADLKTVANQ